MIKLNKEEATILVPFDLDYDYQKARAIREINRYAIANDSLLKLTKAILDGKWEVEEEPLYYVRNNKGAALLRKVNGEVETSMPFAEFFTDNKEEFQLTKQEVASYDPRYLGFLEEVE